MKYVLVPTTNIDRFFAAAMAVQARLSDPEIMGLGLVFGNPGLGKSIALEAYHSAQRKDGGIRTVPVRALAHWSESSMLRSLLRSLGQEPRAYRRDVMFDQIAEELINQPAVLLVDEINHIAGQRMMMETLKDIHDVTGSAVLMIGEQRVDGLLRRFESFYNRFNQSAVVHLTHHTADDVAAVVQQRCEQAVDDEVYTAIYEESGGKSMRSVIDRIREIEAWSRRNGVKQFTLKEWRMMISRGPARQMRRPTTTLSGVAHA